MKLANGEVSFSIKQAGLQKSCRADVRMVIVEPLTLCANETGK